MLAMALFEGANTVEEIEQFLIAYRVQGIQVLEGIQGTRFFHQADIHHLKNPVVDALV